jgi:hypothetical protein
MHEQRNFILTLLFVGALAWAVYAWIVLAVFPSLEDPIGGKLLHRVSSVSLAFLFGAILVYIYRYEDKLQDDLAKRTLGQYYELDGLCFAPMVRVNDKGDGQKRAEISLYYQNRFEGPCEAVIHLRPPEGTIYSHKGARDVHFAFSVQPGAYGVVHQPVAVPHELQGEPIAIEMAAAVRWPRGHGDRLRSHQGRPCGTFEVDWALAFRQSRHELGGEIDLKSPTRVCLTMPENVRADIARGEYIIEVFDAVS